MQRAAIHLFIVLLLLSCTGTFAESQISKPLKVAFILQLRANDFGWNYAHEQGRLYLEKHMPGQVKTTVVENIPESAEVERIMEKLIAQGNKLIFTTSYGYLEPALRVATRHPDVIIMQCQREFPPSLKNAGSYFGRQFEPMYAAGIVAGKMTKTGKLGYIGGHPVPPVISSLNAYTLGAKSVKPNVIVKVVWVNTWFDPAIEAEATKGLIESGADIIASQGDTSLTSAKVCQTNGAYAIGLNCDLNKITPKSWLTGMNWNWGSLYVKIAQSVIDGTWKPANTIYSLKDGYVCLSSFGSAVPVSVRKEADQAITQIASKRLIIFKGPMKDCNGMQKIKAGQILSDKAINEMDWLVDGVKGASPKNK